MRPLNLGTYMRGIYQATQPGRLTGHGRAVKQFMLDKVCSSLAIRSAKELERQVIFKLQELIGTEGFDMHALTFAASVAVGKVARDKVAMGIIEGSMMNVENPDPRAVIISVAVYVVPVTWLRTACDAQLSCWLHSIAAVD